ncbi:MAG: hypothetical protein KTQ13_05310 [Ferruginibacter sp.]|nr:hypothetical protein [Ferruginibacter sp.]
MRRDLTPHDRYRDPLSFDSAQEERALEDLSEDHVLQMRREMEKIVAKKPHPPISIGNPSFDSAQEERALEDLSEDYVLKKNTG